jgi:hypothetical protein
VTPRRLGQMLGVIGNALLLWADWRVALGVFLFAWGDNITGANP